MPQLQSSSIKSCSWEPDLTGTRTASAGQLHITFQSGKTYTFAGVPEDIYRGLVDAPSAGKYYHDMIRGQYNSPEHAGSIETRPASAQNPKAP